MRLFGGCIVQPSWGRKGAIRNNRMQRDPGMQRELVRTGEPNKKPAERASVYDVRRIYFNTQYTNYLGFGGCRNQELWLDQGA